MPTNKGNRKIAFTLNVVASGCPYKIIPACLLLECLLLRHKNLLFAIIPNHVASTDQLRCCSKAISDLP
jgi:hypothetical protein